MPRIQYAQAFQDQRVNLITDNLTSQVDGSTNSFTTTQNFFSDRIYVYVNGVRQQLNYNVTVTGDRTFTLDQTPVVGDTLFVDYSPI